MTYKNLFPSLVEHHLTKNWRACEPYLKEGQIVKSRGGPVIPEGRENRHYQGIAIFQNGDQFLEKLVADGWVRPADIAESYPLASPQDLAYFLEHRNEHDGVYVHKSKKGELTRICRMDEPDVTFADKVPPNFVFAHRKEHGANAEAELRRELGTKTRLALAITQIYPGINAYQLKESGYDLLRMGKVALFSYGGLQQEVSLRQDLDEQSPGPFINPRNQLIAIHRQYTRQPEGIKLVGEGLIDPAHFFRETPQSYERAA